MMLNIDGFEKNAYLNTNPKIHIYRDKVSRGDTQPYKEWT